MAERRTMITLSSAIIAAYVRNNPVSLSELPNLIGSVHAALSRPLPELAATPKFRPTPLQIRRSITPEALISFIDGRPYKVLRRHLGQHGLTIAGYKEKFGLPADYPSTAAGYSTVRSAAARAAGLGKAGRLAR